MQVISDARAGGAFLITQSNPIDVRFAFAVRRKNTVLVFDPSGTCMARYAKLHPFSYSGEDRHYAPGTSLAFFPAGGFEIGLAICYDLRFPELFRALSSRGVDLFLVPANWPTTRREHWLTLLRARAIENLAYVVGVNRTGEGGGLCYPGASIVYGPFGEIVGETGSEAQLLTVELDPGEVGRIRSSYPFLQDAKPGGVRMLKVLAECTAAADVVSGAKSIKLRMKFNKILKRIPSCYSA